MYNLVVPFENICNGERKTLSTNMYKGENMDSQKRPYQIFAIDPGNEKSAYCVMWDDYTLAEFAKLPNKEVMEKMLDWLERDCGPREVVIERMMNYSNNVGQTVFLTCEWIGRFSQEAEKYVPVKYLFRKDEKMYLCQTMKANDSAIRHALIDRFAKHDHVRGTGTKKDPDVFYGMAHDCWSATAIAVTRLDMIKEEER